MKNLAEKLLNLVDQDQEGYQPMIASFYLIYLICLFLGFRGKKSAAVSLAMINLVILILFFVFHKGSSAPIEL